MCNQYSSNLKKIKKKQNIKVKEMLETIMYTTAASARIN